MAGETERDRSRQVTIVVSGQVDFHSRSDLSTKHDPRGGLWTAADRILIGCARKSVAKYGCLIWGG